MTTLWWTTMPHARECDGRRNDPAGTKPRSDGPVGVRPSRRLGGRSQQARFLAPRCGSKTSTGCAGSRKARRTSFGSPDAGDIKRFFDKVEALKRKFQQGQNDPNTNIWQEIQPLQVELNAGLFGDDSIYAKTIRRTLSPDQSARFESLARERTTVRFRATVEWFVAHLDKGLGLTEDQRQRFVELLVNETRAPRKFGQGDYWYLMLRMAGLPESKLKPIFDAPQWRLLSRQFVPAKAMAQRLKAAGVLADEDEPVQAPVIPAPGSRTIVREQRTVPNAPERKAVKPDPPVAKHNH